MKLFTVFLLSTSLAAYAQTNMGVGGAKSGDDKDKKYPPGLSDANSVCTGSNCPGCKETDLKKLMASPEYKKYQQETEKYQKFMKENGYVGGYGSGYGTNGLNPYHPANTGYGLGGAYFGIGGFGDYGYGYPSLKGTYIGLETCTLSTDQKEISCADGRVYKLSSGENVGERSNDKIDKIPKAIYPGPAKINATQE